MESKKEDREKKGIGSYGREVGLPLVAGKAKATEGNLFLERDGASKNTMSGEKLKPRDLKPKTLRKRKGKTQEKVGRGEGNDHGRALGRARINCLIHRQDRFYRDTSIFLSSEPKTNG